MKGKRSFGCLTGILVVVIAVVALVLVHRFVPSIFTAFAWIAGIAAVILIAVIVLIIFLANKAAKSLKKSDPPKPTNQTPPKTQTSTQGLPPEQAAVINKGRADLMSVRRVLVKIHNIEISKSGNDICASLEKLLSALRDKPNKINGCRQFLNYYIPTLAEVLTKYSHLETSGVVTEENTEKVKNFLVDFRKASGKQYQSLFDDDKLDMTVDIEAMTIAIKRDGLLDDEDFPKNNPIQGDAPFAQDIIDISEDSVVVEDDMSVIDAVNQAAEKEKDLVH